MKKYQRFLSENFQFLEVKFSIYLNRHVFVMDFICGFFCHYLFLLSLSFVAWGRPCLVIVAFARFLYLNFWLIVNLFLIYVF